LNGQLHAPAALLPG